MTASEPIVSIVMGVLNGAHLIEGALDSFAQQTLAAKELIVIDGGSRDGTVDILRRRAAELAYTCSEPDRGLYDAWNKAIPRCRGRYIGFLGCDDQFTDERALERLAKPALAPDPPELICSLNVLVDAQGRFLRTIGAPWNWAGMSRSMNLAHACLLHRRDLFTQHGLFNTSYKIGADYDFLLRLGPEARAAFVEQLTVRVGGDGMSHRRWQTTLREHWDVQAHSPHVGVRTATRNFVGNVSRFAYRKLRGRR